MPWQGWQTVDHRRGKNRWVDLTAPGDLGRLAAELRTHLFHAPPRRQREGWTCVGCHTSNFLDRAVCRKCQQGRPGSAAKAPSAPPQPGLPAATAEPGVACAHSPLRRLAPEQRVADAEARAAALDTAARVFRDGGLEARAKELEEEATGIRKKCGQTPLPDRSLDLMVAFVERAGARLAKADAAVKAAEAALAENEVAKVKLAQLRAELAADSAGASTAEMDVNPAEPGDSAEGASASAGGPSASSGGALLQELTSLGEDADDASYASVVRSAIAKARRAGAAPY